MLFCFAMNLRLRSKRREEKSDTTPIRQSRFCAGYFDISREFGSPYHFVDMVWRRVGPWCEHLDMFINKSDGGHLKGILKLGGLCLTHQHCRYNDNEETFKRPSYLRYVDSRGQELGSLCGCFKTCEVCIERLYLANLRSSRPSAYVEFHSNLD